MKVVYVFGGMGRSRGTAWLVTVAELVLVVALLLVGD
jgi:hypothetical protein